MDTGLSTLGSKANPERQQALREPTSRHNRRYDNRRNALPSSIRHIFRTSQLITLDRLSIDGCHLPPTR
jgi:hypothetical protein